MEKIVILGSTGVVGHTLTKKAINKGYSVKTLVRNPDKLGDLKDKTEIVTGNYFDVISLAKVLGNATVVLSTIGPAMKGKANNEEIEKYKNSIDFIIKNLPAGTRFINISGAGMKGQNEKLPFMRRVMRFMIGLMNRPVKIVKEYEVKSLENSQLNWTNVKPPMIKENAKGILIAHEIAFLGMAVDVNQLCDFILENISSKKWVKKAVVVATK